jgi:UDP-3-O-[3-hydroxymyristoyl] glucosamine N-acyltransferase
MKAIDALKITEGEFFGDSDVDLLSASELRNSSKGSFCFITDSAYVSDLEFAQCSFLICESKLDKEKIKSIYLTKASRALVFVKDAYPAFIKLLNIIDADRANIYNSKAHTEDSMISKTADINSSAVIYPGAFIGKNVKIGKNSQVYPGAVVLNNVSIGDDCILFPNVVVYHDVKIGNSVIIGAGSVIGQDGFGYVDYEGKKLKVPHVGSVLIGNEVEIGANTTIDRGTISDTVIGDGTKIDNLVQIAHNCKTGSNCILCAFTGLSGSTSLGSNVIMAGNTGTKGHLHIGDNCLVAARASITKDVPANSQVKGYPARPIAEELKIQTLIGKLPEIYLRLKKIEKEISSNEQANS